MMRLRKDIKENITGFWFALPWIIGFSWFFIYPIFLALYYSFTDFPLFSAPRWIGLRNYSDFFNDELFWVSLYNTLYYVALQVPLATIVGIGLAIGLNVKVRGISVFRTIYFLPRLVPTVAAAILWMWMLNPQYGLVNRVLYAIGISNPPGWIADPTWAKPSIILMTTWAAIGQPIIIYLAALQGIPLQLYEAAELDGAGIITKIRYITLPMISPAILFNVVISLIFAFQMFTQPFIMTDGGPGNSTLFYTLYLYRNAFKYFRMGYASGLAWILFIIVFGATVTIFKTSLKWIYYGGSERK
ncbi:MAG: ABC transporter permease subunit [Clostridia bacterium]|jgi:multiple sugar transport system permease protein|nr:ABC transporter permease subunit [Clostridia bacterium]MQY59605.1 ABC transporter permease subunit [Clostridia bacterium]